MTELEGDESVRRAERSSEERLLDDERRQARDDQISKPGALSQIKELVESGRKTSLQLKTEQAV